MLVVPFPTTLVIFPLVTGWVLVDVCFLGVLFVCFLLFKRPEHSKHWPDSLNVIFPQWGHFTKLPSISANFSFQATSEVLSALLSFDKLVAKVLINISFTESGSFFQYSTCPLICGSVEFSIEFCLLVGCQTNNAFFPKMTFLASSGNTLFFTQYCSV